MWLLDKLDALAYWWLDKHTDYKAKHDPKMAEIIDEFHLKKYDQGEATFITPAAAIIADGLGQMLDAANVKNYVQFDMLPRLDRGTRPIRVTVQWADGESPAAQNARLRDEIERNHYVITSNGLCIPASEASPDQNPQPVTVEWIEASRRGWASLAKRLKENQEWQQIETAPKDGTPILVYDPQMTDDGSIGMHVVQWRPDTCHYPGYKNDIYDWLIPYSDDDEQGGAASVRPTHWMVLPNPPHSTENDINKDESCQLS